MAPISGEATIKEYLELSLQALASQECLSRIVGREGGDPLLLAPLVDVLFVPDGPRHSSMSSGRPLR